MAESTNVARTLGNTRGTVANPEYMEAQTRKIAEGHEAIKSIKVVKGKELADEGMGMFYSVGRGSNDDREPRCIVIEYKGNPAEDQFEIAFVGKGITFDTGGINMKGSGAIEEMYGDKGGACTVLGALRGILELKVKKNIVFAFAFAENSVGPNASLPMDIVTSMKGLTVEIGNTDAEGRLVLSDTFTYVQKNYKPKALLDLATLTGAIRIALGIETAGLFTNDVEFGNDIRQHGLQVFEPSWIMPITNEARDLMKSSKAADLTNHSPGVFGGAIKAAAFMENFIEEGTKWVHLDIAGSAHQVSPKPPICPGYNGFGVQTLIHYVYRRQ